MAAEALFVVLPHFESSIKKADDIDPMSPPSPVGAERLSTSAGLDLTVPNIEGSLANRRRALHIPSG
jgi:hypothetical protein